MGTDQKHWVSVAAAIVDGERVLAIRRRDNNKWEPPGGTLELDESIVDGLRREVREETGLDVEPDHLSGVYKNMNKSIVALVFRCTQYSGTATTTAEVAETKWMTVDEVRQAMDEAYACRLIDAMRSSIPIVRSHDGSRLLD